MEVTAGGMLPFGSVPCVCWLSARVGRGSIVGGAPSGGASTPIGMRVSPAEVSSVPTPTLTKLDTRIAEPDALGSTEVTLLKPTSVSPGCEPGPCFQTEAPLSLAHAEGGPDSLRTRPWLAPRLGFPTGLSCMSFLPWGSSIPALDRERCLLLRAPAPPPPKALKGSCKYG